ncbi:MAG: isochorismatase family protein [Mesorhizobium sp.]|uniref:cysteine hydrolase family protein n=1 Tax=unclassified Mesorhizobium TaxID=325217 RepID=UPI000F75855A|nr:MULTISPECIES: isochorismatase family cysteine hydrolase [unclassified Mesorhizobium]AZO48743.1 cysteine hydrolase [Mesorhizobium sp. M4B.F.Ca.ET.058.02.1.1]RVC43806.1 isochorismatase family protein [Mesorhizobium sp. M4A.F.Ca.ET.090.04.2.1]RWC43611.1 MAG: isochorismatase family protein [Mesorhizobium sp.]RWD15927.1 MAG: isochorismatase family protein [Mesorhizobium sp.]RWD55137.1 MAG: isochorismatase family protein [Mesorhizobium sp.]
MSAHGLTYGPLGSSCVHLCVDMQRLFAEPSPWATPWMARVLPLIETLVARHAAQTIFTRFLPAQRPGQGVGTWKRYYDRWASMTMSELDPEMIELLPSLMRHSPPATVLDKHIYSPWFEGRLRNFLAQHRIDTLVITGGETDVCVLATVLGAIDFGYRVVLVTDALCSTSDATHDALLTVYHQRFAQQVETVEMETILSEWT